MTETQDFVVSDPHFFHELVSHERGFSSAKEHNQWIIDLWRSVVTGVDRVFILGDLTSGGRTVTERALDVVAALPGEKHFISGNHDEVHPANPKALRLQRRWLGVFETVNPFLSYTFFTGERRRQLSLSHFPYAGDHTETDRFSDWRLKSSPRWLLHGHTHSTSDKVHDGNQIHVGLDSWRSLVPMSTIVRLIEIAESRSDHDVLTAREEEPR